MSIFEKVFVCFAAEDRYTIAEPVVYHLKNYGIDTWYDRHNLLVGDNRIEKTSTKEHPNANTSLPF